VFAHGTHEVQLPIELSIPKDYTVIEAIQAAVEELNVKVVHYRLLNKPELYDMYIGEPLINNGGELGIPLQSNQVLFSATPARYLHIRIKNWVAAEAFANTSSQMSDMRSQSITGTSSVDKKFRRLKEGRTDLIALMS